MSERERCPLCDAGELNRASGQLEQSGETFLPTVVSSCAVCGYARFAPAVGVHWRAEPTPAPLAPAAPARRAA
jgi:hypothetical protein